MLIVFDMQAKYTNKRAQGMTLLESLVIMVLLAILVAMLAPAFAPRRHHGSTRIRCVNDLKMIGTAYRIWANDNNGNFPMQEIQAQGGMQEILSNSMSAGQYAYLPYSIMQNELGNAPKIVVCPDDERAANTNFYYGTDNAPKPSGTNWPTPSNTGTFDNTNVSYFIGVGALDTYPQSILGGDRNLGSGGIIVNGSVRVPLQDRHYGISGTTANPEHPCGADAIVNTNGQWSAASISGGGGWFGGASQAVAWSAKMHSAGNVAGAGNIMLGDGSAQQCTSAGLRINWLKNASDLGNFAASDSTHTVSNGSVRLLFP